VTLEWSTEGGWEGDPALAKISPELGLACPECQQQVTHLQVIIVDPAPSFVLLESDMPRVYGWTLIPCLHEVLAQKHTLWIDKRDNAMRAGFRLKEQGCE
jgi:hypothetical protein